jgi:opacity protein-like surface antigen
MKRIYGMAMLAALFALAAAAQDAVTEKQRKDQDAVMKKQLAEDISAGLKQMTLVRMEGGVMSNVKNAPYRADQITETTQTLGDGTRIHNEHQVTIYRDSQGRVRRETPDQISIWDPNSGVGYTLDTKSMTAGKMQVSVSVSSGNSGNIGFSVRTQTGTANSAMVAGGGDNIRILKTLTDGAEAPGVVLTDDVKGRLRATEAGASNKESLGMKIMEGVGAQGDRQTNTIEAGAIGNDRPIQVVSERWYSPDLQVEVMMRHSDPRSGEEMTRLININRAEPDASLFQVPVGYQITEGKQAPAIFKFRQQ